MQAGRLQTSPKGKSPAFLPGATPTWHGESVYLLKLATGGSCASVARDGSPRKTHAAFLPAGAILCSQDIPSMTFGHAPAWRTFYALPKRMGARWLMANSYFLAASSQTRGRPSRSLPIDVPTTIHTCVFLEGVMPSKTP